MVAPLKQVLVRSPDSSFGNADPTKWHYISQPNLDLAKTEHQQIVTILQKEGVDVVYHDGDLPDHVDAIFVHNPVIITDYGAIILKMGKELRHGEETAIRDKLKSLNIPILYELTGTAAAEGGDMLWIDKHTLAIGRGFRTNQEGINQLRAALAPYKVNDLLKASGTKVYTYKGDEISRKAEGGATCLTRPILRDEE